MADFLSRLAERALGVAPVVQPLVPPIFAEPTEHLLELEWDSGATTSSVDTDRARPYSAKDVAPDQSAPTSPHQHKRMVGPGNARDLHREDQERFRGVADSGIEPQNPTEPTLEEPKLRVSESQPRLRDTEPASPVREMLTAPENRQNSPSAGGRRPQQASETRLETRRTTEAGSLEHRTTPGEVDQQDMSYEPPSRSQETSGRPEPPHLVETDSIRRDKAAPIAPQVLRADPAPTPLVAEDTPVVAMPDRVETQVEQVRGAPLPSQASPNGQTFAGGQEGMLASQALPDRFVLPDAPLVRTEMVRSRPKTELERASQETHMSVPEPPTPTVRVNIGRIEVRAITPPPPPVRRPATTRSAPALSLDAYLKQRNEGQR